MTGKALLAESGATPCSTAQYAPELPAYMQVSPLKRYRVSEKCDLR
jgi:hypothetical protein